jgi:photosystem II stability/assembly factor-like uncharacterized protein
LLVLALIGVVWGQAPTETPRSTPPVNQSDDPLLKTFRWRSIGPASMAGRIDDIEAVESNPFIIYVGFATGGLWKTVNNGTTWGPVFDTYSTHSIGDMAIFQANPDIIWVGTGEPNNRQSSSFGDGIYKSMDGGKTFTNMGLRETQSIARIVLDPKDPNVAYVAALGHLFGPNRERGIYKTVDGGKNWTNIKFIDENTGFTELVMDPSDPRVLYAASYQRRRTSWGFNGGGPGSGIWKTVDAGKTWTRLAGNGLPAKEMGRIGLDVCRSSPNVVYAQIELEAPPRPAAPSGVAGAPPAQAEGQQARGQQQPGPPNPERSGVWRSNDKGKTWSIVSNQNNRPMYYSQIRVDPGNPDIVYTGGAPFFKSVDGGKTFQNVAGLAHSDHHAIWINPKNGNHLLVGNDGGLDVTYDQCATWEFVNTIPAGQFYAVAVDMRKPYYVYGGLQDNGSWGGPSATRVLGITNADWYRIGGGDGFHVQVDPTDCNTIYVESQNGAVQRLDLKTGQAASIRPRAPGAPRGQRPGAAAQPAEPAPDQPPAAAVVQTPFGPFGGAATSNIIPRPPEGEQYRFNWSTPVVLSPHNPRIVYVGANKLFTSRDRGETWTASPDLTRQIDRDTLSIMGVPGDKPMLSKNDGMSNYGNITTVSESPVVPGILWVGTDDGSVQLSRDGGATWSNVADNIPGLPSKTYQVSRVEASHFDAGTCYLSFDGHRADDLKPYVFVTRDFGQTWKSLVNNLPEGNVNVITEDPKNKNLLYLGTEFALYVSLNGGAEWKRFMTGLPTVRIDDILVHPRDNDLIVGTHGRSIYIIDDIAPLQQLTDEVLKSDAYLFTVRPGVRWLREVTLGRSVGGAKNFIGENPAPGTAIGYYLKSTPADDVKISILDYEGKAVRDLTGTKSTGLNRVQWDLRTNPPQRRAPGQTTPPGIQAPPSGAQVPAAGMGGFRGVPQGQPVEPGVYRVKLTVGGKDYFSKVVVEEDTYK